MCDKVVLCELSSIHGQLKSRAEQLARRENELEERAEQLARKENELEKRAEQLARRENELEERAEQLARRESELEDRYDNMCKIERSLCDYIDEEVSKRTEDMELVIKEKEHVSEAKGKENTRLKQSFDVLRSANEYLKKQLTQSRNHTTELRKQVSLLTARLGALKQQQVSVANQTSSIECQKKQSLEPSVKKKSLEPSVKRHTHITLQYGSSDKDVLLGHLLAWAVNPCLSNLPGMSRRVVPIIANILPSLPQSILQPALEFCHWLCRHTVEDSVSSSFRRIGVFLASSSSARSPLTSESSEIRILSSLLVLESSHESSSDVVSNVLHDLRGCLRTDVKFRQVFLSYHGPSVLLAYIKPIPKHHCSLCLDIVLELTVSVNILDVCSGRPWFEAMALLLKTSDVEILEKVCIVLQRLSRTKHTRKLFKCSNMLPSLQALLNDCKSTPFLLLNVSSILSNLETSY